MGPPALIPPDQTVVSGPSFFESASMSVGTLTASTVPGQPEAWILSSGAINAALAGFCFWRLGRRRT